MFLWWFIFLSIHPYSSTFSVYPGDPKSWQNKSLPGDPNYMVGANCVSVLIDHFWGGQQQVPLVNVEPYWRREDLPLINTHTHTHTHSHFHKMKALRNTKWRVSWLCSGFVYGNLWDLEGGLHSMKCCFNLLIVFFIFTSSSSSCFKCF